MRQCNDKNLHHIEALLTRYGFEIKQATISELIEQWTASYSVYWIRLAIVEALYQGRYKAISVEHILGLWKRLGHPTYHFTYEFERFITRNVFIEEVNNHQKIEAQPPPKNLSTPEQPPSNAPKNTITLTPIKELVKKIAVPISLGSEKLTPPTNHQTSLKEGDAEEIAVDKPDKDQLETEPQTSLQQEKTPRPINQFVPPSDASDFYGKLRAVAYQQLEDNQDK